MTTKGVDYRAVNYMTEPLSAETLKRLLASAGLRPQDALRTNEETYRRHIAGRDLSDEKLLQMMVKHPELIQRPIVVKGKKAVLARPVEKLAELGVD